MIANWRYKCVPIPENPSLTPADVTTVIATLGDNLSDLIQGIQCHIRAGCQHIYIGVPPKGSDAVKDLLRDVEKKHNNVTIQISTASCANKREQVLSAIENIPKSRKEVHKVIVLADDDISFAASTTRWLLAPLEDSDVMAVGTCKRAKRIGLGRSWSGSLAGFLLTISRDELSRTRELSGLTGRFRACLDEWSLSI